MVYAFISDGRLYVFDKNGQRREIESRFVLEKLERDEHHKSHSGWKDASSGTGTSWCSGSIWGGQSSAGSKVNYRFQYVISVDEDTICYVITNGMITGLFKYSIKEDFEERLFHRNDFFCFGIDYSSHRKEFVIAVGEPDGQVNLQLLDERGSYIKHITGGDSRDCNPVFSLRNPDQIIFQSAGIGRDEDGYVFGYGPEMINRVDLESDEMSEVVYEEGSDYLLGREDSDGNIYCICRPYKAVGYASPFKMVLSVITFPFRFLAAMLNFLNTFTKLFSQGPLTPAGPGFTPPRQNKYVNVLGRTIDLAKVKRGVFSRDDVSLVPGSWRLVCIRVDGSMEVLAAKVSSYDIGTDGDIHYTTGYRVSRVSNTRHVLQFKHNVIENISVVRPGVQA